MVDFLLELIDFNSEVPDYSIIIPMIFFYLFVLWAIVSIWVFFDAKKRFESIPVAILIAVLNLFLQFPFLFVYLLIRPHSQEDFDDWIDGGVNVPVVNFTGPEGVEMSFELRVFPKRLASDKDAEMRIDVSFSSEDVDKKVVSIKSDAQEGEVSPSAPRVPVDSQTESAAGKSLAKRESRFSTLIRSINGRLRTIKAKLIEKIPQTELDKEAQEKQEKQEKREEKKRQDKLKREVAEVGRQEQGKQDASLEQGPGENNDGNEPAGQAGEPGDSKDQKAKKKKKKKKKRKKRR